MFYNQNLNPLQDKQKYEQFRVWLICTLMLIGGGIAISRIFDSSIPFAVAIAVGIGLQLYLKTAWFMGTNLVNASDEPNKFWIMIGLQTVALLIFILMIFSGIPILSFNA